MTINDLIQLLNNRLREFQLSRDYARMNGDLERMNVADKEVLALEDTLYKLNLLADTSKSAAVKEAILAEVMTDGSVTVLSEYDIAPYATDPLHEEKIMNILSKMGVMDTVEKIDDYISGKYLSSPVTGEMIMSAAEAYTVDARLMMAMMELDSRFGTIGVAVGTLNPGNVGNDDDGNTRTYESWQEGVTAVAEWLNRHRGSTIISNTPPAAASQPEAGPPLAETLLTITPMATSTPLTSWQATSTPLESTTASSSLPLTGQAPITATSTTTTFNAIPATATSTPTTATTTPVTATSTPTTAISIPAATSTTAATTPVTATSTKETLPTTTSTTTTITTTTPTTAATTPTATSMPTTASTTTTVTTAPATATSTPTPSTVGGATGQAPAATSTTTTSTSTPVTTTTTPVTATSTSN
jgi:hypothetical protein